MIATVAPSIPGSEGKNVFNAAIPFRTASFKTGKNASFVKGSVTASVLGNVRENDGAITVHPLLEVMGG